MSSQLSSEFLHDVVAFLKEFQPMYDFKWTELYNLDIDSIIPTDWQACWNKHSLFQFRALSSENEGIPPQLWYFLRESERLSLRTLIKSEYCPEPDHLNDEVALRIKYKKFHEVECLCDLVLKHVKQTRKSLKLPTILDIGSGLGYVDKRLAKEGFRVIAVEGNLKHHENACKQFDGSVNVRCVKMELDESPQCLEKLKTLLKDETDVLMISLHSCGELTSLMISMFHNITVIRDMLCVPCCYQRLTPGKIPASKKLKEICKMRGFEALSSFGLRLACQETPERWFSQTNEEALRIHGVQALFRSLLCQTIHRSGFRWRKPRRRVKTCMDFHEYVENVKGGFKDNEQKHASEMLHSFYEETKMNTDTINFLKVLQTYVQPVMEGLILLDYQFTLEELNHNVSIISCFQECISPRNLCLSVSKEHRDNY